MTQYIYRILLLYPQSRRDEIEQWYAATFPDAGPLLTPCGTKGDEDWYAASFVATKADVTQWLAVFGANLGVEVPAGFVDMPRQVQRQWIDGVKSAAIENLGIYVDSAWNDQGEMVDYYAALQSMGIVKREIDIE